MATFVQNPDAVLTGAEQANTLGPRLLTLDEVAAHLGMSRDWVRDHTTRRSPRIPAVRLGGRRAVLRFRPQDVQRFIDLHLAGTQESV
jgi:predicted DNA-binding transcriptional regulator AlpA